MSAHLFPEPQPVGRMKVATAALSRDRLVHVIAREGDLLTVEDPLGAEHVVMRGDVDLTGRSATLVDTVVPVNLAGAGVILGEPVYKGRDARIVHANTPVHDPAEIPQGGAWHIGGGVWRSVCRECPAYVDTWGLPGLVTPVQQHEHDVHGLDVIGVNVAVLP